MSAAPAPVAKKEFGRDLVVQNQGNAVVPMPQTFAQMLDMAKMMSTGGAMVGLAFRDNPGACLGALVQAMRWGMDPYAVSQKCYVASKTGDGPIAYEGQLVHAVILKNAPLQKRLRCRYEGEGDERRIRVIGRLEGEDEDSEYLSPPVAKLRKPEGKGSPLWRDDPDQQLWYYGVRAWTRKWCPDVLMGVYTPDEVSEIRSAGGDAGGEVITLSGAAAEQVQREQDQAAAEADFTPIDGLLNKGAPAKEKPAEQQSGGPGLGDGGAPSQGNQQQDGAAQPEGDSEGEPEGPTDEEIVAGVEVAEKQLKGTKKGTAIEASKGALQRIAETGEPEALRAAARALLERYA